MMQKKNKIVVCIVDDEDEVEVVATIEKVDEVEVEVVVQVINDHHQVDPQELQHEVKVEVKVGVVLAADEVEVEVP